MYGVKYWEENCWASKSLKLWSPLTFRPGWQVQSFQVSRLLKPYLERCFGLLRMSIRTSVCIEKLNFDINVVHTHQFNQNHVFLTGQSPFEPDETPLVPIHLEKCETNFFPLLIYNPQSPRPEHEKMWNRCERNFFRQELGVRERLHKIMLN